MTNEEWLARIEKQIAKNPTITSGILNRLLDIEEFDGADEARRASKIRSKAKVSEQ